MRGERNYIQIAMPRGGRVGSQERFLPGGLAYLVYTRLSPGSANTIPLSHPTTFPNTTIQPPNLSTNPMPPPAFFNSLTTPMQPERVTRWSGVLPVLSLESTATRGERLRNGLTNSGIVYVAVQRSIFPLRYQYLDPHLRREADAGFRVCVVNC